MCTSRSELNRLLCALALPFVGATGCYLDPPEFRFGEQVTGRTFTVYSENAGIHPFDDVLADPNNPFAYTGVADATRFEIFESGGNVASFYAWATSLAVGANGEAQYYAALSLEGIFEVGEAAEEELPVVRRMAIRAYQSLLDNFPDSVTFAANGIQSFRLATPSYLGIVRLGGIPQGDWVLVETPNDGPQAVRGSNVITTGGD